ncbi:O-antigen ligase family protein [Malonomonas rubra]|uniref:O-antigen ligase family protein n=1 Tax=Malonomonas rubra TaxID=57040 RepID=UPI001114AC0B|nr:O-antigen ligase family protein [Malonomonas rubra]
MSFLTFFGLISALFGLYQYSFYMIQGPSDGFLIPYFLPHIKSLRVTGFYGQPNLFSVFLIVIILSYFYKYSSVDNLNLPGIFCFFKYFPFFVVSYVFFLTGSRAGTLSLLLIIAFMVVLVLQKRLFCSELFESKEFWTLVLVLICAFSVYRLQPFIFSDSSFSPRALSAVGTGIDVRFLLWMSSFLIFFDNFLFGTGLGTFGLVQDSYALLARDLLGFVPYEAMSNTDWAHNELFQLFAETGFLGGGLCIVLLIYYFYSFLKLLVGNRGGLDKKVFFIHLFIFPFIFQSMFSWVLRSPQLLVLFFVFLGIFLANNDLIKIKFGETQKKLVFFASTVGLFLTCLLFSYELSIGKFREEVLSAVQVSDTLQEMNNLVDNPYSSYRVMSKVLPHYAKLTLAAEDVAFAKQIIPLYIRLVSFEGSRWQWYDLARLYLLDGRESEARGAIEEAIDLMPSDNLTWSFLHYLNMLEASRNTGRPLESFWPQGDVLDFSKMELSND